MNCKNSHKYISIDLSSVFILFQKSLLNSAIWENGHMLAVSFPFPGHTGKLHLPASFALRLWSGKHVLGNNRGAEVLCSTFKLSHKKNLILYLLGCTRCPRIC